ncbi:uncharacterized protein gogo [Atheta coriaria]|uniref:uncharacterized protein gogo n=1 Tax=Dalotia coriaria TaxID=877792 RepID=UPI0031F386A1
MWRFSDDGGDGGGSVYPTLAIFLLVFISLASQTPITSADGRIPGVEITMPPSHTALSGDLHIQIAASSFPPLLLQLSRLEGETIQALTTFPVLPEARALALNTTIVTIPCGYFSKGGQYYVLFKKQGQQALNFNYGNNTGTTMSTTTFSSAEEEEEDVGRHQDDEIVTRALDVRWPMPQLSLTPEYVQTYPERPVMAILEFPEVICPPMADSPPAAIPEFWLELHYCGHSLLTCDDNNNYGDNRTNANVQVLYSEQVRGFPGRRVLTLRCELFGLAGHYSLVLRPTTPTPSIPHTAAYVKADWSDQFVFNVHARSIFPCETHTGIPVLFQYPSCILSSGDRVRLYARLRDNVASLAPPTSLEYVVEQRVTRGQHSLYFDCDLFSERFVEYCFVYVSQAITGAVADVRMDCVPTLPVTESESGGWGEWSPWTPCSSTCIGGTRNRYRFCDSPPPRYGAKFCEGPSVETEKCGTGIGSSWECFYTNGISANDIAAEIPEVQAEVGPYCRCGCIVHLGHAKPRRLLATSSQSCPGRTFWLIQADDEFVIQFKVEQFHLPCGTQWLKVRDGRALSSTLLIDLGSEPEATPSIVNSTGPNILLEFFTDEVSTSSQFCGGGFLAHAEQLRPVRNMTMVAPVAQGIGLPISALKLTAVHIAAIFFLSGLLIATALLGAQYAFRYRKYHIAQAEDQDSLADISASSASLPLTGVHRASSNATLLSEVISLTRLRPTMNKNRNKHSRLRESVDCSKDYEEQEVTLAEEETLSASSTMTLTHAEDSKQQTTTFSDVPDEDTTCSLPSSPQSYAEGTLRRSSTIVSSEKDRSTEKNAPEETSWKMDAEACRRRLSHTSTITLTNGSYSPANSIISRATIRSTNPKESKEKRNREKLLAGPGSDFSLSVGDGDLEMDYYDYNVVNAGAAPGSYLGMDPAFLVWIPPLEEGEMILEENETQQYVDSGSNKESPEEEELLPKRLRTLSDAQAKGTPHSPLLNKKYKKVHPLVIVDNKISCESLNLRGSSEDNVNHKIVSIQMHDFSTKRIIGSPVKVHREKETVIEKLSPPGKDENLDEIRFADEEDEEIVEIFQNKEKQSVDSDLKRTQPNNAEECNNLSYHDVNVLSTTAS